MHFQQKYHHNWPQGRPHETEFELFSNTEKEDVKMESDFQTSLNFFLIFFDKCFG